MWVEGDSFATLGPGLSVAVFGGLRQVIANYFWLSGYVEWEERDVVGAEAKFAMAVAADPQEWYFWSNGARMIAYDFPRWELDSVARSGRQLDVATDRQIRLAYAIRALEWLDGAEAAMPRDYRISLERAMILLHAVGDRRAAAAAFRECWERPGAPIYTARIHGELLRKIGEEAAAYRWYCDWLSSLDSPRFEEQLAIVLPRIRALEEALDYPAARFEGAR
jgi:hypothetical protein